jgi:hypothetical protein
MRHLMLKTLSLFFLSLIGCKNDSYSDAKFFVEKDTANGFKACNRLFVFIGEKVNLKQLPSEAGMDGRYLAKYKVLQTIYGGFLKDTIEFEAYDHYGLPSFAAFKNAMLFVRKDSSRYLHLKYQYFGLYKTVDNRWAAPYTRLSFYNEAGIMPVRINFKENLLYDRENMNWYIRPKTKLNGEQIDIYGNYIPELLLLKKQGVLQSSGFF